MFTVSSNIIKSNSYLTVTWLDLQVRDEITNDLLTNICKDYSSVSDKNVYQIYREKRLM